MNNIGLYVTVTGKVTYAGPNYFYLDDGAGVMDNSAYKGVKVGVIGLPVPAKDRIVKVTGVSSCLKSGADLFRFLRASEITVVD